MTMKRLFSRSQRSPSFSEVQIQAKIAEFWRQRGFAGNSPEEDREQAIAALQAESSNQKDWKQFGNKDDREFALKLKQFQWERVKTIISAFGLGATAIAAAGLFFTYLNAQKEQQLNTERLITDRFTKAVEQLGHQDIAVRIGGIYALERIAKDSPKDHWTVMEILTAFVRERSSLRKLTPPTKDPTKLENLVPISTDIQSALTVIGRRDTNNDPKESIIDLQNTNLVNMALTKAKLQESNFFRTNLQGAQIVQTEMQGAFFDEAHLESAILVRTNLQNAVFPGAKLQKTKFFNADLRGADFVAADLRQTSFVKTNLQNANFEQANLQETRFREANLQGATFDNDKRLAQALFCRTTMPNGTLNNRDCKKLEEDKK